MSSFIPAGAGGYTGWRAAVQKLGGNLAGPDPEMDRAIGADDARLSRRCGTPGPLDVLPALQEPRRSFTIFAASARSRERLSSPSLRRRAR